MKNKSLNFEELSSQLVVHTLRYVPVDNLIRFKRVNRKFRLNVEKAINSTKVFDEWTFSARLLNNPKFEETLKRSIVNMGQDIVKFDFALLDRWRETKKELMYTLAGSAPNLSDVGFLTYKNPKFNTLEFFLIYARSVRDARGATSVKRIGFRFMSGTRSLSLELQMMLLLPMCPLLERITIVYGKSRAMSMNAIVRWMVLATTKLPHLKKIVLFTESPLSHREITKRIRTLDEDVRGKLDDVLIHKPWTTEKVAFDRISKIRYCSPRPILMA